MAYCFYNGVKLPERPSDVLADYPYCWIRKNDNTEHYDLVFTKIPGYYDATAGGIVYGMNEGTTEIVHYRVPYASADSAESWDNYQTTNTWMALDANRIIMWSNHYIPNGSLTATEMYFDGSEAIPDEGVYQIQKDTLVGFADQVRRLCKTENTMTPAQMTSNLEGLNIELMETYVISTEEEQVIYPDEGYYGFSKITVGAVDLSSGGSGGGSGTGGSDGSAEDMAFGYNYDTVPEETGQTDYNGVTIQTLSSALPYQVIIPWGSGSYMGLCSNQPFVWTNASNFGTFNVTRYERWMMDSSGNWYLDLNYDNSALRYYTTGSIYPSQVRYANHAMVKNYGDDTTTPVVNATKPVAETTGSYSGTPTGNTGSYTIEGSTLNELGGLVQQVTGTTGPMTPNQMIDALRGMTDGETTEEGGT